MKKPPFIVPEEVSKVTKSLENAGFEAYLVGGCVRNLYLDVPPKDWDVTTNATPEQILAIFPHAFSDNDYGTVGVVIDEATDETLKVIEITPYRTETSYSNARHPDSVSFSTKIEDDLRRRDFTFNAIAYRPKDDSIIDYFGGVNDLKEGVVRAVGEPKDRFMEDGLRILRAIRLAAEYGFAIEANTLAGLIDSRETLGKIAKERIRDELIKIIESDRPMEAMFLMKQVGILEYVIPELEKTVGVEQNQAHKYTVFEHLLRALQHAADKKMDFDVRLAALLHDISKPETRRKGENGEWTFYGHEVVGSRVTQKILENLKFPKKTIDKVVLLVRWHMFFSDPDQITLSAVRRMIQNVGEENIEDLLNIRICDRIGTGRPKEQPFRFRKYKAMVDEARRDPISVEMLVIDGKKIMEVTHETPGPRIGFILHALLEIVLEDPKKNEVDFLTEEAAALSKLQDAELRTLGEAGKRRRDEEDDKQLKELRSKHFV